MYFIYQTKCERSPCLPRLLVPRDRIQLSVFFAEIFVFFAVKYLSQRTWRFFSRPNLKQVFRLSPAVLIGSNLKLVMLQSNCAKLLPESMNRIGLRSAGYYQVIDAH